MLKANFKTNHILIYIILFTLAFGFSITVSCQPIENSRIFIYNKIPVQIESGIFFNKPSITEDGKNIIVNIISSQIKIGIGNDSNANYQVNLFSDAKPRLQIKKIHYTINSDGKDVDGKIINLSDQNVIQPILDTFLNVNNSLQIVFTNENAELLQIIIRRVNVELKPIGYLQIKKQITDLVRNDRLDFKEAQNIPGIVKYEGQQIDIDPQNDLLILFENPGVTKDSSIFFRKEEQNKNSNSKNSWNLSGHLLLIDSLEGNTFYNIQAKYAETNKIYHFRIKTAPYWYQTIWFLFGVIFFLCSGVILAWFNHLHKKIRKEKYNSLLAGYKLKAIQSQIEPHFIFNTLSSFQWLIDNKLNDKATIYLNNFSQLMRKTLLYGNSILIPLEEEISLTENYLQIQQLRYGFKFKINFGKNLDISSLEIPPFLIQPSIENAIRHGIGAKGEAGNLEINFTISANDLLVEIRDNGGNYPENNPEQKGYGERLVNEKVEALNYLFKEKKITYSVDFSNEYTSANFKFQNWL